MQANPNFWRGKPAVDEIDFRLFKNGDAMAEALKKGEIDFAEGLETNVYNSLKNQPNITTVATAPASFDELAFNTGAALDDGTPIGDGNPLLKDKNLRVALAYAIDKQAMVDKVLGGDGIAGDTIMPPRYTEWHVAPTSPMAYDPEKAKQLLDAAGYKVGSDGIRTDAKGNRLSFRLFGRTDSTTSQKAVQFIKGYLAAVGVEANVKMVGEDNLTELIGQGNYDMFEWGWGVEPDPNYMLNVFTCANRSYKQDGAILANVSDSFYCNPAYDALNGQQQVETDLAKRQAITGQMMQMLYNDAPYIITYFYDGHEAYRSDRFTNLVHQPEPDGPLTFQWGTWTYEQIKPVTAADANTDTSSGGSSVPWLPIIGGLIVAAGAGFLLARRRPASASTDDRE
jgi:peptide/nickel transport system substrate-binding protein